MRRESSHAINVKLAREPQISAPDQLVSSGTAE